MISTYPQSAGMLRGSETASELQFCGDAGLCGIGSYSPVYVTPSCTPHATRICMRSVTEGFWLIRQTQKTFRTYPQTPQTSRSARGKAREKNPAHIPATSPHNPATESRGDRHV